LESSPANPRYSFRWSANVVHELWEKCPRATILREWEPWLSDNQLAFVLATRTIEWQILRDLVKTLHAYIVQQDHVGHLDECLLYICVGVAVQHSARKAPKELKAYLTRLEAWSRLEEQVKRLGGSGGNAEGSHPSNLQLLLDFKQ